MCKLDLDLRLPRRYFEFLMERMTANPRIATCSGKAYVEEDGRLVEEWHGDDTSIGASKFYRVTCFKVIGGFVREVIGTASVQFNASDATRIWHSASFSVRASGGGRFLLAKKN